MVQYKFYLQNPHIHTKHRCKIEQFERATILNSAIFLYKCFLGTVMDYNTHRHLETTCLQNSKCSKFYLKLIVTFIDMKFIEFIIAFVVFRCIDAIKIEFRIYTYLCKHDK